MDSKTRMDDICNKLSKTEGSAPRELINEFWESSAAVWNDYIAGDAQFADGQNATIHEI